MTDRSALEIILFLLLLAASAALFWRRFGRVLRIIRGSRPDADFQLRPLARRWGMFVRDVLCQVKVIRERPWPGLAHALVFWGFCAFSLVTIDHLLAGAGVKALPEESAVGRVYCGLAALFAVAVSGAIVGLAIRRFVVRPKWLGEKASLESGFIAFLILALMLTYLAEYIWHPAGLAGRALWWAHTAALAVFLPLIPHTKHLHLALSPVTVFLSRGGFARIPPLAGEEDFGVSTGADVTRIAALQAFSCVECGRCQQHCPAHATGKILNPKAIALGFRSYLNEYGAGAAAPLMGAHLSEEAVFQCTTCGACEYQCPVGVEHLPLIIGLRRGAVNTGQWDDEYGARLFLSLERHGNPLGMAASERGKFVEKHGLPLFDGAQDYCLWLGCMGAYDPAGREIVLALARVMRSLGVSFGVLKKERCTGDAARRLGNDLAFQELAEWNIEALRTAQVKRLLSICPHCVRTIGTDWRECGAAFEIEHHSVFLARHLDKLPAGAARGQAVFHDPCYLGRYQDVYDEPRAVVARFHESREPERARQRSFCCGAGGGLTFLGEEKGSRVSHERARELAATGAPVVAAACPFCHSMLRDALAEVCATPPRLLDIAQIAAAGLEEE